MHQNKHPLSHNNRLELLAPAKNLAYGIEAINHGADAVYMGEVLGRSQQLQPVVVA